MNINFFTSSDTHTLRFDVITNTNKPTCHTKHPSLQTPFNWQVLLINCFTASGGANSDFYIIANHLEVLVVNNA